MIDLLLSQMAENIASNNWFAPFVCFLAGFLTSLTPCSLSVIPLIIGFVKGSGTNDIKRAFRLSAVFSLGMALSFTALGAIAATLGKFLGSANRYFYLFLGILMLLMALQTWEIYTFIPATYLTGKNKRKGYLGALISGLLGGLFSSACATPVLIVLLSMVARSANPALGVLYLFLFSAGHCIVIIAAGTSTGFVGKITSNPSYGAFSNVLKIALGMVMLLMGLYMLYLFF